MFILVIQGSTSIGDVSLRTDPLPPAVAIGAAARMATSPTPAEILPATRSNLDRYPAMVETEATIVWLYRNRPMPCPVWVYRESFFSKN
jgi:hypothetical protein